jgi:hypothetical protein
VKITFVGEVHPARAVDELLEHAAVAGHHEPHVRLGVHDFAGDIEERHGVLLRGHAPEEEYERRVFFRLSVDDSVLVLKVEVCVRCVVAVVDDRDFMRVDAVLLHEDVFRVITHGDDLVCHEEAVAFLRRDPGVWLRVRAVEFRGVDVRHEGHAVELRGADARFVGHPVMAMDHVGFEVFRHGNALFREAPDGFAKVGSVEILDGCAGADGRRAHRVHALGIFGETVVRLERARHETNVGFVGRDRTGGVSGSAEHVCFRMLAQVHGEHERHLHVILRKASHEPLARDAESSRMEGGILPAEHDRVHGHWVFV